MSQTHHNAHGFGIHAPAASVRRSAFNAFFTTSTAFGL
jgi:hypothetical protein